jgi:hypothetical protein
MEVVIGVDPDSTAFGVAEYWNGVLVELKMLVLVDLINSANSKRGDGHSVVFSIEDVMANKFVYARNQKASKAAQSKVAMHIGRCQQSQVELVRMLDHYKIPYVLHKPQKGNWSDKRELFERITGWEKQSNPDTRAAAYFGFLAVK